MNHPFTDYTSLSATKRDDKFTIRKNGVRISVITSRLIRVEVQLSSVFTDGATQTVVNRNFENVDFTVTKDKHNVMVKTKDIELNFSYRTNKVTYIKIGDKKITDLTSGNLKGTRRTLDFTNGRAKLSDGILSKNGVAVLDDSESLIIKADGNICPRTAKEEDIYYFAYGNDYISAVQDFYKLTGSTPLIPRFALGNWWSRYKAYTQDEYLTLMKRFDRENVPLSVATVDMDWHWVDVVGKFGDDTKESLKGKQMTELFYNITSPGWTGYSWNTDLFPDPDAFLKELKDSDLKVTLNIHPASGCRYFEDSYKDFAEYMGIDADSKEQIPFDITDEKFTEGYFKYLHHPHEEKGVDFWWIDWQQGTRTKVKGLDPLWALNHYHFLDNGRDNKRPLILSRFAGAGSHRYPLGFSGDSSQTWATLNFQPEFTATASNIGYSWWSHDIGGHHYGSRDDELYLRWVQFGVFSPIMRLHSTSNEFMGKEPWKYRTSVNECAKDFLRFRHRILPYIYTMNAKCHFEGLPLIRPLYYHHPMDKSAYKYPNEYYFGDELIACPVTSPVDKKTGLASVCVYLPEGRYTDIFSDRIYEGGKELTLFRDENSMPVLAREGAIIPLDKNCTENGIPLPTELELLIFRGNSSFEMYEDDGETMDYREGKFARTKYEIREEDDNITFTINAPAGDRSVLPQKRYYTLSFRDIAYAEKIILCLNGEEKEVSFDTAKGFIQLDMPCITAEDTVVVTIKGAVVRHSPDKRETKIELVSKLQELNNAKGKYVKALDDTSKLNWTDVMYLPFREADEMY